MKTREELAEEYADGFSPPVSLQGAHEIAYDAHLAGFDAGFARAVELMRTRTYGKDRLWGDWLEQQQRAEDKK